MDSAAIFELIGKKLANEASEEELNSLDKWLSAEKENQILYHEIEDLWKEKVGNLKADPKEPFEKLTKKIVALKKSADTIKPIEDLKLRSFKVLKVAASIILIVGALICLYTIISPNAFSPTAELLRRSTPKGTRTNIILSDGTVVWLNGGSKLSFPAKFAQDVREVYLEGEAYFDVKKNRKAPFVIHVQESAIKVYGTSFNIRAYREDKTIETTVLTGKVAFIKAEDTREKDYVFLTPNQKVVYSTESGNLKTHIAEAHKYSLWKEGKLVFDNTSLVEASRILERWYGLPVKIKNRQLLQCRLTGTFQNQSLDMVLSLISLTDEIDYELHEKYVLISGKGCN